MRNKTTILIALFTIIFGCNSQDDKKIVKDFLENIVIDKSSDISKMINFLKVSKDSLKTDTDIYKRIQFNVQFLRNEINGHSDSLEVLTYEEFKKKEAFEAYKIVYEGKDKVYCVVQGSHFITSVLINENHKITAFFTGIVKNKGYVIPHLLE